MMSEVTQVNQAPRRRTSPLLLQLSVVALALFVESRILQASASQSVASPLTAPEPDATKTRTAEVTPAFIKPYFEDAGPKNVTAIVGHSALLKCRVKHPGNRTVSWMRKRDLHILTSGVHTYTGDGRFSVVHPQHSDDWDLRVEYVQDRDEGVYECQLNTEPKINMAVTLSVEDTLPLAATFPGPLSKHLQDAQAVIWGPTDVYVKRGSTISLTCTVNVHGGGPAAAPGLTSVQQGGPAGPAVPGPSGAGSVMWHRGQHVVDFDSARGGISLETERTGASTTSRLLVTGATFSDTGNYTCVPSNARPASVYVHILSGENPAAMQTGSAPSVQHPAILTLSLFLSSFALCATR